MPSYLCRKTLAKRSQDHIVNKSLSICYHLSQLANPIPGNCYIIYTPSNSKSQCSVRMHVLPNPLLYPEEKKWQIRSKRKGR